VQNLVFTIQNYKFEEEFKVLSKWRNFHYSFVKMYVFAKCLHV